MKKETFMTIVEAIQEQYQKENKLADFWHKTTGEYFPTFTGEMFDKVVDAIDDEFDTDMLSWWLWDAPHGIEGKEPRDHSIVRDADGTEHDVSTLEKLYDYMVSQKETK